MGKFWFGVGLLLLSLFLGLWIEKDMTVVHDRVCQTLAQAADRALSGDMDTAAALARQAQDMWVNRRNITAMLADHMPMDEIDSLFAQLEQYARWGEDSEFTALCSQLSMRVQSMGEAHRLTWYNFLTSLRPGGEVYNSLGQILQRQ